jgi:protein PhnA
MSDTKDCNGKELNDGDSVFLTKDLDAKGSSISLKRGTVIKKIRLSEDTDYVDCRIGKSTIAIKTCFLKKK